MPRSPSRPSFPAVTLIALVLLTPTLATALPQDTTRSVAEPSAATPGLFAKLWDYLSTVWANGPGLDPDGTDTSAIPGPGTEPSAGTGDNGPGLDPNG